MTRFFRCITPSVRVILTLCLVPATAVTVNAQENGSTTLREMGIEIGVLPAGPLNAITDVAGVAVGHRTVVMGDSVNTGITVVLPHAGNLFRQKVEAAVVIGNGFGKLIGYTQIHELGEIESPIVLTCTLCVHRAADAVLSYLLALPGNEEVRSVNVVVGETNDGFLNDIRARRINEADVLAAIHNAAAGPVEQGSVGAGRGTTAFGWKGGIGTSSRVLPGQVGGWTVGVLVQSNFGGILSIDGVPVGRELNRYYMRGILEASREDTQGGASDRGDGSIMIIVATDAPLSHRNLERLAHRALYGVARTGSAMTNGSGDYVISFSTTTRSSAGQRLVDNNSMSPLFLAVIEATEEAIYNSLFAATTVSGHRGTVAALPLDSTLAIMARFGRMQRDDR
ncbi:MAG: P1 family peptidase [Gemmatimonadetes bacterium]|nr:P1 family peptidase [Gemmatimonadota bacterium]